MWTRRQLAEYRLPADRLGGGRLLHRGLPHALRALQVGGARRQGRLAERGRADGQCAAEGAAADSAAADSAAAELAAGRIGRRRSVRSSRGRRDGGGRTQHGLVRRIHQT